MIVLRALGTAEIETGLKTLTPSQEIVFAAALYLVLERERRVSRTQLASILWPHTAEKVRGQRLRQTILQLKKVGFVVLADRNYLRSDAPSREGIAAFTDIPSNTLAEHASLEFLPGYSPSFSETFRDWLDARREEAHALVTSHLVAALCTTRTKGDWLACDRLARQCLKLDPFNEAAVLAQAEASAMRGAKKQAVERLDRYLVDIGSYNADLRLAASVLRRRISERIPERTQLTSGECAFVGRDREMAMLTLQMRGARHGKGGVSVVVGDAGIGKSRLASELIKFAALEGVQTCRTTCRRSDTDRPMSVFLDLVPQLTELRGALGCSQETLGIFKKLTEFDGHANSISVTPDDSISAYAAMRHAIIDLFDAIADEQALLVVVDDVQWLDSSSVRLLEELLPWTATSSILLVLTERPGEARLTNRILSDDLNTLTLGPLKSEFAKAIIGEVLKDSPPPTDSPVLQRLLSVGEGNPFFLQELSKHWLETGKEAGSPPSITAIIDDRLARLSNEALLVLQACAILDINASIERVEQVLEYKAHVLLAAVQELSVSGMLRAEDQAPIETLEPLTVRHDLVSTAAVKRLARPPLEFLHRRAAIVLERETVGVGARTAVLWASAFHWRHAGDRERAFRAACSCAEHLLEVGLPHDASQAFERALTDCVTDEERRLVLSRLALSLQMCGQWEHSKEILRKSQQIQAKSAPNVTTHDDVEVALFEARWRASLEHFALLDDLKACVRNRDATPSHRVACGLLGLKVATDQNQVGTMEELFQIMLPLLRKPTIPPVTRLEVEMIYHSTCGDMRKAEHATDRLLDVIHQERDPRTLSRALCNIGVAYRLAGRTDDAEAVFLELLEDSVRNGLVSRTSFAILALVRIYLARGDLPRARDAMQRLETLTAADQDIHRVADRLYFLVRLALEEGNVEEAAERYATVTAQSDAPQSVNWRAAVLALGVRIQIQKQAPVDALQPMVHELEEAHLQNRGSGWQDFEACSLALGLRYCGDVEKSLRILSEYATTYRREQGSLPEKLSVLLQELRENYAVSATRRMEPLSGVL